MNALKVVTANSTAAIKKNLQSVNSAPIVTNINQWLNVYYLNFSLLTIKITINNSNLSSTNYHWFIIINLLLTWTNLKVRKSKNNLFCQ